MVAALAVVAVSTASAADNLAVSGSSAADNVASPACTDSAPKNAAAKCIALPRPQDQLWLVSDRTQGCADARPENLQYWRYQPGQGWQAATGARFFAADHPAAITAVWIHGNRIDPGNAFEVGWTAYSAIARQAKDDRPLRFVIWSWASERIQAGPLEDIRVKADRTAASSLRLTRLLDGIRPDVQITLIGYSFGARIATGALHLLGGGALNGHTVALTGADLRPQFDVVLMAAALDSDWILPGHCHGKALDRVGRLLLVDNSSDRAIKRYHLLYGLRIDAQGLGVTGVVGVEQLGAARSKIEQFDAACYVGPEHDWSHYFGSSTVVGLILPYVFQSHPTPAGKLLTGK